MPTYMRFILSYYRDHYEAIRIMKYHKDFERCSSDEKKKQMKDDDSSKFKMTSPLMDGCLDPILVFIANEEGFVGRNLFFGVWFALAETSRNGGRW